MIAFLVLSVFINDRNSLKVVILMDQDLKREDILAYLNSRKESLQRDRHVRKIALIGSFARNQQQLRSDIDVLVDIEEGTPNIFELKRSLRNELEKKFGRTVEIASERYLKPYYREQILREAVYV
jgi:predicted nucleotidyltransferase